MFALLSLFAVATAATCEEATEAAAKAWVQVRDEAHGRVVASRAVFEAADAAAQGRAWEGLVARRAWRKAVEDYRAAWLRESEADPSRRAVGNAAGEAAVRQGLVTRDMALPESVAVRQAHDAMDARERDLSAYDDVRGVMDALETLAAEETVEDGAERVVGLLAVDAGAARALAFRIPAASGPAAQTDTTRATEATEAASRACGRGEGEEGPRLLGGRNYDF